MSREINKQSEQIINLVGKLLDVSFRNGKTKDGRAWEGATATIRVTQTFGGKEETSEVPVSFMASPFTSKNTPNPAFASIQELKKMKTVQNVGFDEADRIRITGGSIRENAFVARSGLLVDGMVINGSFVSAVSGVKDTASFHIEIFIMDMHPEVDRNDEPTGRLIIKGGIIQYGGKLDVVQFIVEAPDTIDYIERNWDINDTLLVKGFIRMTSVETPVVASDSSWGEDIPETTTRTVRELIITKGSNTGYDEEFAYNPAEVKKLFNVRKARIEQLQLDAKKPKESAAPAASGETKYSWE